VAALLAEPMSVAEAAEAIRSDPSVDPEVRRVALELTGRYAPSAWSMFWAAYQIAMRIGADAADYERALRWAEVALGYVDTPPDTEGPVLNTIGLLHYRLGHLDRAAETLERSAQVNLENFNGSRSPVFDHVVLAMVAHKSGDAPRARDYLNGTREKLKDPRLIAVTADPMMIQLLGEAEALIEPKPKELPDDVFTADAKPTGPGPDRR
jgi:hypothetical protein